MARKYDSSTRVLTFVLTVAFGLLSAVIAYASFKGGSFELRSKAATEEVILKQWTFDKVAEGWDAIDFLSSKVSEDVYKLMLHPTKEITSVRRECNVVGGGKKKKEREVCKDISDTKTLFPRILNTKIGVNFLYPINKFRMRLAVLNPIFKEKPKRLPSEVTMYLPVPPAPPVIPFIIKVSPKYKGNKIPIVNPIEISAVADGREHEYSFEFPNDSGPKGTSGIRGVEEIQIDFSGLNLGKDTIVSINDISIFGRKEVPPTPTKKPPVATQTLTGYVRTYPGEGSLLYKLAVSPAVIGETVKEYLLTQNTVNPCGTSKTSKLMCRYFAPPAIDFARYVDKLVTVTGSILKEDATIEFGQEIFPEKEVSTQAKLSTFVVSTIKLITIPSISPSPVPIYGSIDWYGQTSWLKAEQFNIQYPDTYFTGKPDQNTKVDIRLFDKYFMATWQESKNSMQLKVNYHFDQKQFAQIIDSITVQRIQPSLTQIVTFIPDWTIKAGYPYLSPKDLFINVQSNVPAISLNYKNLFWFPGIKPLLDVENTNWSWKHIQKIIPTGIMTLVGDELFNPSGKILRSEMALFLSRAYEFITKTTAPIVDVPFTDIGNLSKEVQIAIKKIYGLKVTAGTSATAFSPDMEVNRAQMATFLSSLYKAIKGDYAPEVSTPFTDIGNEDIKWAKIPIGRIYGLKVTSGISATEFGPYLVTNREQMATFIMSFIEALEK